ncbi:MAG: Fic family protein [Bacteroidota bacterium]
MDRPPYEINNTILKLLTAIAEKIGEVNAVHLHRPSPELRKRNRVKTIKASLEIEGNSLSEEQITAIIEHKRVMGPKKDILEVVNAIKVYEQLPSFTPTSLSSFLKAHQLLMNGLIDKPGALRTKEVGIFKGAQVSHIAPPPGNLDYLMRNLFDYLKKADDPILLKSCVVHYEIEFIHPFMDGNGRMGRLWQTLILMKSYPIFEFLPFETIIKQRQDQYYEVLEASDKAGKSTVFIEFILAAIDEAFEELLNIQNRLITPAERMDYFLSIYQDELFTRKDYQTIFKDISSATASRDLRAAVDQRLIEKQGDKRTTKYKKRK